MQRRRAWDLGEEPCPSAKSFEAIWSFAPSKATPLKSASPCSGFGLGDELSRGGALLIHLFSFPLEVLNLLPELLLHLVGCQIQGPPLFLAQGYLVGNVLQRKPRLEEHSCCVVVRHHSLCKECFAGRSIELIAWVMLVGAVNRDRRRCTWRW